MTLPFRSYTSHLRFVAVVAIAAITATGCLDRRSGTVSSIETPQRPDPAEPGDPVCTVVGIAVEGGIAPLEATGYPVFQPPLVDGSNVVLHQPGAAATQTELVAFDAADDAVVQLTTNEVDDVLIDSQDGALLFERVEPGGQHQLIYSAGAGERVLDTAGETFARSWEADYVWATRRRVANDQASWRRAGGELVVWERGDDPVVYADATSPPDLHSNNVAFLRRNGEQTTVRVHQMGGSLVEITTVAGQVTPPSSGTTRVFWTEDSVFMSGTLDGEITLLDEGPCSLPASYGDRAVATCAETPAAPKATDPYWLFGNRLVVFDGTEVVHVPTTHPTTVVTPRISGDWVAWHAYPAFERMTERGKAMAGRIVGDDFLTVELGDVGMGCPTCQVPTPPPSLALSDTVAAWTYGQEAGRPISDGDVGYAILKPVCSEESQP